MKQAVNGVLGRNSIVLAGLSENLKTLHALATSVVTTTWTWSRPISLSPCCVHCFDLLLIVLGPAAMRHPQRQLLAYRRTGEALG